MLSILYKDLLHPDPAESLSMFRMSLVDDTPIIHVENPAVKFEISRFRPLLNPFVMTHVPGIFVIYIIMIKCQLYENSRSLRIILCLYRSRFILLQRAKYQSNFFLF